MKRIIGILLIATSIWIGATTYNVNNYYHDNTAVQVFNSINAERVHNGIQPLVWDNGMAEQARNWSKTMSDNGTLFHSGMNYAENIAMGYSDSRDLYQMWKGSEHHHKNYMDARLYSGAIGVYLRLDSIKFGKYQFTYNIGNSYATFIAY